MARNSIPQRPEKSMPERAQEILSTTGAKGWSHALKLASEEAKAKKR